MQIAGGGTQGGGGLADLLQQVMVLMQGGGGGFSDDLRPYPTPDIPRQDPGGYSPNHDISWLPDILGKFRDRIAVDNSGPFQPEVPSGDQMNYGARPQSPWDPYLDPGMTPDIPQDMRYPQPDVPPEWSGDYPGGYNGPDPGWSSWTDQEDPYMNMSALQPGFQSNYMQAGWEPPGPPGGEDPFDPEALLRQLQDALRQRGVTEPTGDYPQGWEGPDPGAVPNNVIGPGNDWPQAEQFASNAVPLTGAALLAALLASLANVGPAGAASSVMGSMPSYQQVFQGGGIPG